jgi:arginase
MPGPSLTTPTGPGAASRGTILVRLGAVQGRVSDMSPGGMIGAGLLAQAVGLELHVEPAIFGEPSAPKRSHWTFDLAEARPLIASATKYTEAAFKAGQFPLMFLSECATSVGTAAAVHRHRPEARIIWFDAHGDFNTPETTTTAYLGGITLTGASGYWHTGFGGDMQPDRLVLVGARDLDLPEAELLAQAGAKVLAPGLGLAERVLRAVENDPVWVHIDCDVLDPMTFRGIDPDYRVPGGPTPQEVKEILAQLAANNEIIGLEVAEFDAPSTPDAQRAAVLAVLDMIGPLLAPLRAG